MSLGHYSVGSSRLLFHLDPWYTHACQTPSVRYLCPYLMTNVSGSFLFSPCPIFKPPPPPPRLQFVALMARHWPDPCCRSAPELQFVIWVPPQGLPSPRRLPLSCSQVFPSLLYHSRPLLKQTNNQNPVPEHFFLKEKKLSFDSLSSSDGHYPDLTAQPPQTQPPPSLSPSPLLTWPP